MFGLTPEDRQDENFLKTCITLDSHMRRIDNIELSKSIGEIIGALYGRC